MAFGSLILTNAANSFTAQAWASSGVITITRVGFGSGFPGVTDFVPGYTGLKTPVMNGTITGINNLVAGQLTVRANISSANAPFTFNVNEIGVFGKYAGGAETLLAYCTTGANTGDTVVPTGGGTPVVKDYALLMIWQQAISSSGVIQLIQQVGLHAASHQNTGVDPIPVTTSLHTGLLPISPGDGTQVPVSTSPVTWAPALLVIRSNVTLYVSTAGNNSTALPNDITHPWATVQGALNYLIPYFIEPGFTVTIQVADGTYSSSVNSFTMVHPQGSQISILGSSYSTTFTGGTLSGSASSYSLPITVASTSHISTNGYIGILPSGAGSNLGIRGVFKVTNVSGSVVTIAIPINITLPSNEFSGVTGTVIPFGAIIQTTGLYGGSACIVGPVGGGLGQMSNILFSGNGLSNGISLNGIQVCNLSYVGTLSHVAGLSVFSATANADHSFFTSNSADGVVCSNSGSINLTTCGIISNQGQGVHILRGGNSVCSDVVSVNNFNLGFAVGSTSQAALTSCSAFWNGTGGLLADQVGFVISTSGFYTATVGGVDVSASGLGYVWLNGGQTVATYSPSTLNSLSPSGGYIQSP